jgi:hypothetical protein
LDMTINSNVRLKSFNSVFSLSYTNLLLYLYRFGKLSVANPSSCTIYLSPIFSIDAFFRRTFYIIQMLPKFSWINERLHCFIGDLIFSGLKTIKTEKNQVVFRNLILFFLSHINNYFSLCSVYAAVRAIYDRSECPGNPCKGP